MIKPNISAFIVNECVEFATAAKAELLESTTYKSASVCVYRRRAKFPLVQHHFCEK